MKKEFLLPRRAFLAQVSALGAVALAGTGKLCADNGLRRDALSCADFARHVGSTFLLYPETGGPVPVQLMQAREVCAAGPRPGTRPPFALLFRSPVACQSICPLEHPQLGRFAVFLAPVGRPTAEVRLEAVFG